MLFVWIFLITSNKAERLPKNGRQKITGNILVFWDLPGLRIIRTRHPAVARVPLSGHSLDSNAVRFKARTDAIASGVGVRIVLVVMPTRAPRPHSRKSAC